MAAKAQVPDSTTTREIVSRSYPSLNRPRLSTEAENRLADVELRSAECYTDIENITQKFQALIPAIDEASPEVIDWDEEPSVVTAVEDVRTKLEPG